MALPSIDDVIAFWFEDDKRWWKKDPAFDAEIREHFGALHQAIEADEREDWLQTARGALAYVIVLDQFSRNMFRDTGRMFASDARALRAAKNAIDAGHDQALSKSERGFLYMPLMHSEALADQERCIELFAANDSPNSVKFAQMHRDIVQRFGRFPHRNALLGRESTDEEREFLQQPGSSF